MADSEKSEVSKTSETHTRGVESQVTSLSENPTLQITTQKLDGLNYLTWSQSALIFIRSKGKMGYLNGKITEPLETDPTYDKWEAENSTVMSWLVHSMKPEISQGYLFLRTAKEIWDVAAQTYSKMGNKAQVYDLKRRIQATSQGDWYVATYYHNLRGLWQELDHYQTFKAKCTQDAIDFQKFVEDERIYEF